MAGLSEDLERRRPVADVARRNDSTGAARPRALVVGVVLADQLHTAADTSARLGEAVHHIVEQRWVVVGADGAAAGLAPATVSARTRQLRPKYEFVNEQLAQVSPGDYDYLLVVDDDVIVPFGFLDAFLDLQSALRFAIAQPAREVGSSVDHPIVARNPGLVARETWFVEQGPIVSFHRTVLDDVVPFDLRSPMGWGYECVWSKMISRRGLSMGVIDAVSVDHGIRPVLANYAFAQASAQSATMLAGTDHRPIDECMRVVRAISERP